MLFWKWATPGLANCAGNHDKQTPSYIFTGLETRFFTTIQNHMLVSQMSHGCSFTLRCNCNHKREFWSHFLKYHSEIASIHQFYQFHIVVYKQRRHFSWPRQSRTWSLQGNKNCLLRFYCIRNRQQAAQISVLFKMRFDAKTHISH